MLVSLLPEAKKSPYGWNSTPSVAIEVAIEVEADRRDIGEDGAESIDYSAVARLKKKQPVFDGSYWRELIQLDTNCILTSQVRLLHDQAQDTKKP